jgi:LDH2 family malate/lactate/ureidoglycolate dehydrogenase
MALDGKEDSLRENIENSRPSVKINCTDLVLLAQDLLVAAGADVSNARAAAEIFVEADLRGMGGQGVDYVYYVLDCLKRGIIDGKAKPTIERETDSTALIDGNRGLGQPAALMAVEVATEKARKTGTATVVIKNSTDIFMIGAYSERLAGNGLIGMVLTSGPPLVHPYGGVEKVLSTNPVSIAIPRRDHDPLVLDMATSALSGSRIRQAGYHGEAVPPGTGIGPDGKSATDPAQIRKGAISPLGGHKGYGLALCIGLLCGPMTGSGVGPELSGWQATGETKTQGHFFYAVDPGRFGDFDSFIERTERYISVIKNSRKASGVDEIRIPGERGAAARKRQERDGIEILEVTWKVISERAKELGVKTPPFRKS